MMNISPSNIFLNILLAERFHQNCLAAFGYCQFYWIKATDALTDMEVS